MRPDAVRSSTIRVDESAATILEGLADRIQRSGSTPAIDGEGSLAAFDRSIAAQADAVGQDATHAGMLSLYGELAVAVNRVASGGTASLRPAAA